MTGNSTNTESRQNSLMMGGEHPVISAARKAGVDPYALIKAHDLNGLMDAAMKGNPQLGTDSGQMMLQDFAQQFKSQFGMTDRDLPGAPTPNEMPGALAGPRGKVRPLPRQPDYGILGAQRQPSYGILGDQ